MGEPAPGETLDQYELLDVIARSGMATIFRARDRENGHTVALKVPHLEYASDLVFPRRFECQEAIGQRLAHPTVIKVLRPRAKSRLYLVMEYVDGELLRERLRGEGRLPIATAIELGIKIADALVYLHGQGVVHRDLKPENIMLTADGGVKLMDFGIAFDATQGDLTWSGLSPSVGTPEYMAPEQVRARDGSRAGRVRSSASGAPRRRTVSSSGPCPTSVRARGVGAARRAGRRVPTPQARPARPGARAPRQRAWAAASSLLLSPAWLSAGPARRPVPPGSRRAAGSADAFGFAAVSRGPPVQIRAPRCGKLTAQAAARREARRRGWGPALPAGSMPAWLPRYEARR